MNLKRRVKLYFVTKERVDKSRERAFFNLYNNIPPQVRKDESEEDYGFRCSSHRLNRRLLFKEMSGAHLEIAYSTRKENTLLSSDDLPRSFFHQGIIQRLDSYRRGVMA